MDAVTVSLAELEQKVAAQAASLLVWRVQERPTGRYRSFCKWQWPQATFKTSGNPAAVIGCDVDYRPSVARSGEHPPLRVSVVQPSFTDEERRKHGTFRWRTLVARAKTLEEAKTFAAMWYVANPDWMC